MFSSHRKEATMQRGKQRGKKVYEEAVGTVQMTREGYGFVIVEGCDDDIFIPAKKFRGALHNDLVKVAVTRKKSNSHQREGEVIEVLERSKKPYIGVLQIIGQQAWVIVESRVMPYDISVPIESVSKEQQGLKVAVLIENWPKGTDAPIGKIIDILGKPGENNTEMHAILAEFGLPYKFSDEIENAAAKIPIKIAKTEISKRRDFRDVCTFTIDPADAKDFDDALSFRKTENGNFEIGVHIADVTYYVHPNDILDQEAYDRGTSVYLVDRTVPMLPEILSNNLCSLRPNEEKLTYSAVFELDSKAHVLNKWFGRTIIKSDMRFAYEQAQEIIETDCPKLVTSKSAEELSNIAEEAKKEDQSGPMRSNSKVKPEVREAIVELHKLASQMRKKRFNSGSISFERPEMKVKVDETGKPIAVVEKVTFEANWLIEEFMLLANKEVATYVTKGMKLKDPTFVYRIHETPNEDKIQGLRDFIKHFGYTMGETKTPKDLAKELNSLLEKTKNTPENSAISILALRAMARAQYSTDNVGHYGLGFDYYTHFTSPIRRYPDMMVHRLLTHYLEKGKNEDKNKFEGFCKHASDREQLATQAERASVKYKTVEFMQDKIDSIFDGTISGITEWGMYVEIEPTKIEGMVPLREIKEDYFVFDEKNYCITGKSTHKKFTLGDKVKIKVAKANLEQKLLDFSLVWEDVPENAKNKAPKKNYDGRGSSRAEKAKRAAKIHSKKGKK